MNISGQRKMLLPLLCGVLLLSAVLPLEAGGAELEGERPVLAPALYGVSLTIDAGHGGSDPGALGESCTEKEINLAVALHLAEYCRAAGAEVTLTRESDIALAETKHDDLQRRIEMCRQAGSTLFISLHCNSFVSDRSQHGAQMFYHRGNEAGRLLAEAVRQSVADEVGDSGRSTLAHPDSFLLKNLDCAAVICEMGFLSNADDEALLIGDEYQWQLAWGIFCGLLNYLKTA